MFCRRRGQPAALLFMLGYLLCWLAPPIVNATTVYQTAEDFIRTNFESAPEEKVLWLNGELAEQVKSILGHDYHKLRVRYWIKHQRSAWILEEIGKEHYITAGFVIERDAIRKTGILVFRESRGWEIKHRFFTGQFEGLRLTDDLELNRDIDNITGATLSVKAVERMAKLALVLHQRVHE